MKEAPFTIERTFNAPVEKVWDAISNEREMKAWYFDVSGFKPEVGFKFSFTGQGKDGDKEYVHLCEVKEVISRQKLSYSWRYEGLPGDSLGTFELFAEGDTTRLKLTHEGLGTFAINGPDFAAGNFAEGWNFIIGKSLPDYLNAKF